MMSAYQNEKDSIAIHFNIVWGIIRIVLVFTIVGSNLIDLMESILQTTWSQAKYRIYE